MIGVDEVGRGCWAGPLLVVAARPIADFPDGLRDSKLLSRQQRNAVYGLLTTVCSFGEGWVWCQEIDKIGLADALRLGVKRALDDLKAVETEEIIMDGKVNYIPANYKNSRAVIDADNLIPIVSAASIIAKVLRDRHMYELAQKYPLYGFDSHVGYGTKAHMLALKRYGALKYIHRSSFAPINQISGLS